MEIRHLNQVQLARRWNNSPRTLERWRWLGQGPRYLTIGGRIVYRLEDIEAYEAAQLHAPKPKSFAAPARNTLDTTDSDDRGILDSQTR